MLKIKSLCLVVSDKKGFFCFLCTYLYKTVGLRAVEHFFQKINRDLQGNDANLI